MKDTCSTCRYYKNGICDEVHSQFYNIEITGYGHCEEHRDKITFIEWVMIVMTGVLFVLTIDLLLGGN